MICLLAAALFAVKTPEPAKPYEAFAARELSEFLARRTEGAALTVAGAAKPVFHVGDTGFALSKGLGSSSFENEGWAVRSFGGDVVLNGGGTHGALYAVYRFLEDVCQIRFWSETEIDVPSGDLAVEGLDLKGKPYFVYRDIYRSMNPVDSTSLFAIRRRLNRNGEVFVGAELGGAYRYGPPAHAHSFSIYIPWAKYGREHPEWFALREGVRVGGRGNQLCVTDPGMRREFLETLRANIAKGEADARAKGVPPPTMYDVSMNDTPNSCQCAACRAEIEKRGLTGLYLAFANYLADEIKKDHPDVFISTLAYYFTEDLPKDGTRPADNLIVRLCDTRSNQAASHYEDGNDVFRKLLAEWGPVTKNLYVWDYATTYAGRTRGFPFASEFYIGDTFKLFAESGVKGIFLEHEHQNDGDLWEIKYHLESRLMEDPFQPFVPLLKDAFSRYFGPAAGHVYAARRHLDRIRRERGGFIGWTPEFGFFDYIRHDDIKKMLAGYDAAEKAVAGDGRYLRRVRKARAGTDAIGRLVASFEKFRRGDGFVLDEPAIDIVGLDGKIHARVDDPASPCGRAVFVEPEKSRQKHYDLPFMMGVFDAETRKTIASATFAKPVVGDGYGVYALRNVRFPRDSFVFATRAWTVQIQCGFPQLKDGRAYDVKAHVRFQGPRFYPGDTRENAIYVARFEITPSAGAEKECRK